MAGIASHGLRRSVVLALGVALLVALLPAASAEAARKLSIGNVSVNEPEGSGMTQATFTVALSKRAKRAVTVHFATADGTAEAPGDYTQRNDSILKVKRGKRKATLNVTVNGDDAAEDDETFVVELSDAHRASIADGQGTGTILANDASATPVLTEISADCVSVGSINAVAGSVTLSSAAEADTFVSITSGSQTKATIFNGGTTVPMGQTTVNFQATGLEAGTSALTASLNAVEVNDVLEVADPCPADVTVLNETDQGAEADSCRTVFPTAFSVQTGTPTQSIFGRIFEASVTEAAGAAGTVTAQFGYGPQGTDPRTNFTWEFFDAPYNMQVGNEDEYQVSITAPAPGVYLYAYRFSFNGGQSVTYCDADASGAGSGPGLTFDPAQLGTMTVTS